MSHSNRGSGLFRMGLLASASASALLVATSALAQPADQPPAPPVDQNAPPANATPPSNVPSTSIATEGDTAVTRNPNEIVVTGTRIRQPEFTSPDPVARIDPTNAKREGKLDLGDTLQSSPIAAGSTQITSALSSNFVTNGGPGAQTIDLRGLGANRTLVLLNGRRAGPAGTRGGVSSFDLNVLPQAIVKQVDILKTGASSIYGSDAVAGVVNLITKTDFNGFQIDAFGNIPINSSYGSNSIYNTSIYASDYRPHGRYSAGAQYDVSLLWGKTFDRGHVMVALDYFHQNELARGDRKYLNCPEAYVFKHNGGGRADVIDPRTGKFHCEDLPVGQVWTYDFEYNYLGGSGNLQIPGILKGNLGGVTLVQYFPGNTFGAPNFSGCGDFSCFGAPPGWLPTGYNPLSQGLEDDFNPFASEQTIIPKTSRYTAYVDASYEVTDNIELYGEFLANRRKTYQNGWRQFWTFGYTSSGSYCAFFSCYDSQSQTYLPPAPGQNGAFWASGWTGLNLLSPTAVTNRGSDSSQKVDYWRGVGGIRGDFGGLLKGWSYDAYVQYSHNKGKYRNEQILQDVIDSSYFQTSSCVGTVLPVSQKQCIDLPWVDPSFLYGNFTPEQADFLFDWEEGKTIYKQLSGEASVSGHMGPVGLAFGITARRDSINDKPGEITLAGNAWGSSAGGITAGHSITQEAFGEMQLPVLSDRPGIKSLTFSAAARVTNVKNVRKSDGLTDEDKGNWTYKFGGNWAATDWLRFRGTIGTSFRAPALFEEFKADETSFVSARSNDPCVQLATNLAQGNISQRIFDNCRSQGFPLNYGGGSITATAHSQGGIGGLNPETSKAKTVSIILTPTFAALPSTKLSLAVDYFDITVKDEVTQLGARNIVFGCYDSDSFPTDPLCSLFDRGAFGSDPRALTNVYDNYINVSSQKNRGVDFTLLIQHNLGRLGNLTFLGNATYQLEDKIAVFRDVELDNNGIIGDPKFVGQFNLTWKTRDDWTFFWGTELYGRASNEQRYKDRHGGSLCHEDNPSPIWGDYCVKLKVPAVWYHAFSVSKNLKSIGLEATLGMRNIFDKKPPRVSTIGGGGLPALIGPVVGTSQYDFLGRRIFLNVTKKF